MSGDPAPTSFVWDSEEQFFLIPSGSRRLVSRRMTKPPRTRVQVGPIFQTISTLVRLFCALRIWIKTSCSEGRRRSFLPAEYHDDEIGRVSSALIALEHDFAEIFVGEPPEGVLRTFFSPLDFRVVEWRAVHRQGRPVVVDDEDTGRSETGPFALRLELKLPRPGYVWRGDRRPPPDQGPYEVSSEGLMIVRGIIGGVCDRTSYHSQRRGRVLLDPLGKGLREHRRRVSKCLFPGFLDSSA